MNFFSLFRSSAAEIIFSKKIIVSLYGVFGLAIAAQVIASLHQFMHAYTHGRRFDTEPTQLIATTLVFFLPLWITGALILRACLQRMRLALWARRAFTFAEYTTELSPAEAGFLVDYEYNHKEFVATLVDLHYKGYLRLTINQDETIEITWLGNDPTSLSAYEQYLIGWVVAGETVQTYVTFNDPRLVMAAKQGHLKVIDQLTNRGLLQAERLPKVGVRNVFRAMYAVAGFVGIIFCYGLVFQYDQLMSVKPLYPMVASELWVLSLLLLATIAVVISGLWPHFSTNAKDPSYAAWTEAAGFMLYLRTVYTYRFALSTIAGQDANTVHRYAPYAVAFGIIGSDVTTVAQLLTI
jgi:hypothetical protein